MTFQVGEKVVYPNHGVGTIENISSRSFGIQSEKFYLLRLSYNSLTVMVPFSHVDVVGLRKVTKNGEITKVLNYLATGESKSCQDWKDRFKENSAKMQSGSLLEVAEVLKCLVRLQAAKPLSFREKKMLDRARIMLVTELATSRAMKEPEAADVLGRALSKSNLKFPEPL
ncbi:MAG: CarD family transcriptional regulator [Acidobacteria bacterium]|jgi:CarD family transcriptional regulator|nr:CarD family transcriptional regulator [Acidobacteriota bacterium]